MRVEGGVVLKMHDILISKSDPHQGVLYSYINILVR